VGAGFVGSPFSVGNGSDGGGGGKHDKASGHDDDGASHRMPKWTVDELTTSLDSLEIEDKSIPF